tara:strand:- start:2199 stop:2624 length:426 start_codon:yes stop_codon:yes gene_type:complete
MAIKRCSKCKEEKAIGMFWNNKSMKDGLDTLCMECRKDSSNKTYAKNADLVWERQLLVKYGITVEDYNYKLEQQRGGCAICFQSNTSGRRLAVDHNHDTGVVRGLLCGRCNIGLGQFGDNVDNLEAAIDYLNYTSNYRKQT